MRISKKLFKSAKLKGTNVHFSLKVKPITAVMARRPGRQAENSTMYLILDVSFADDKRQTSAFL